MTLNQVVKGTLDNSKMNYKMAKSNDNVSKFIVNCDTVKLHGIVTNESYKWQIRKLDNTVIDESECSIKNTDEMMNRINESITTGAKLSKYVKEVNAAKRNFLKPSFVTEAEDADKDEDEKELLLSDEEVIDDVEVVDDFDVQTVLDNLIQKSVDLAAEITGVMDAIDDSNIEAKQDLIGLAGNFYGIADDIDTIIDDLYPVEDEDIDEACNKRTKKTISDNKKIIDKLSEASVLMRNNPKYKDIRESIKLLKSELILRK